MSSTISEEEGSTGASSSKLGLSEMRSCVADLMKPKPWIYWTDFVGSMSLAWASFGAGLYARDRILLSLLFVGIGSLFFYRGLAFTHELVHLGRRAIPGFHWGWHLLCGVPMLAPHFLYRGIHLTHHSKKYASDEDGEYLGFGQRSRWLIVLHFAYNAVLPVLSVVRFMIIGPLSVFSPKMRATVVRKMSFMGLRFTVDREGPRDRRERMEWWLGELACTAFCWTVLGLVASGVLPAFAILEWYLIVFSVLTMNSARSLGATHGYEHEGEVLGFEGQLKDSVSVVSRSLLTHVLCPVGTQYHALHHLFPQIPYHSLAEAHDRLRRHFPAESIIHETSRSSLFEVWSEMWVRAR